MKTHVQAPVALITGGATGIGKEVARRLAERGVVVYISGRREAEGAQAAAEIGGADASRKGPFFVRNDVTDEAAVRKMVEAIVAKHGRLDMAVNNAGISNENKAVGESDSAAFRAMIETNVLGPAPDDWLEVYEVSSRVNKPENNDADLLRPVAA